MIRKRTFEHAKQIIIIITIIIIIITLKKLHQTGYGEQKLLKYDEIIEKPYSYDDMDDMVVNRR